MRWERQHLVRSLVLLVLSWWLIAFHLLRGRQGWWLLVTIAVWFVWSIVLVTWCSEALVRLNERWRQPPRSQADTVRRAVGTPWWERQRNRRPRR